MKRRIAFGIPLALLAITLVTSCSKQRSNAGSEKKSDQAATSQPASKPSGSESRKVKYYKSTMMLGENQPGRPQRQYGDGHGAGLRGRGQ